MHTLRRTFTQTLVACKCTVERRQSSWRCSSLLYAGIFNYLHGGLTNYKVRAPIDAHCYACRRAVKRKRSSWRCSSLLHAGIFHDLFTVTLQSMNRVGQKRKYTPYMTVYLVIPLPKLPYMHCIYMVLANPQI